MGFFEWADDKLERYLRRRGMGDVRRLPTEAEIEAANKGKHRPVRPRQLPLHEGICPCGSSWLHNELGDADRHRAWLRKGTK